MPLSDTANKNAKPADKLYKIPDEKGMYLFVHCNGGKYFRLDYRFDGKRKTLAPGVYPDTGGCVLRAFGCKRCSRARGAVMVAAAYKRR